MNKKYDVLLKDIARFKKRYKKVELVALPIDLTTEITDINTALEQRMEDFYIALLRPLTRLEFGMFNKFIQQDDHISALEVILNNCWLMGDNELKDNDDYFIALSNTLSIYESFMFHVEQLPSITDSDNLIVYIRKEGKEKIEKLEDVNDTDFYKYSFRKANRNDLRNYHKNGADNLDSQEDLLCGLCISDTELIRTNDSIFFTLLNGDIIGLLVNQKVAYLKKN